MNYQVYVIPRIACRKDIQVRACQRLVRSNLVRGSVTIAQGPNTHNMTANQQNRLTRLPEGFEYFVEVLDWPRLAFHQAPKSFATPTFDLLYGAFRS